MYTDIVLMERNKEAENLSKKLGFEKLVFKEEFSKIGLFISEDPDKNRKLIEGKKIKILANPHVNSLNDSLHHRSSGLNQVMCRLMHENDIALGVSLNSLYDPVLLGRFKQNIKLCRKYKVRILFFTFAESKYELRGREDMLGFLRAIGMTGKEAKNALN